MKKKMNYQQKNIVENKRISNSGSKSRNTQKIYMKNSVREMRALKQKENSVKLKAIVTTVLWKKERKEEKFMGPKRREDTFDQKTINSKEEDDCIENKFAKNLLNISWNISL